MSNEAINWALTRSIKHSTAKFVLVVMANCADEETWEAWPSVAHLAEATSQDRKTVLENVKRLIAAGLISDTRARKGGTKQVIVYRLNKSENGTVKETQKRTSTESGTVPDFPPNSPVIPYKESQNSLETVPKTGHGTLNEPSTEPKGTPKKKAGLSVTLPSWLDLDSWESWVEYRKSIKAALSPKAATLCIAKLELLREQGSDPKRVIEQSIMSGKWTGLFPIKADFGINGQGNRNVNEKFNFGHLDRSGDIRAAEESARRHGITALENEMDHEL